MDAKTAQILDGKALATKIQMRAERSSRALQPQKGRPPGLAVLMVGTTQPAQPMFAIKSEPALRLA